MHKIKELDNYKPFDLRRVMRELNKGIATDGERKVFFIEDCWNNAHACIYKARKATKRTAQNLTQPIQCYPARDSFLGGAF